MLAAAADIPARASLGDLAAGQPAAGILRVSSAGAAPIFRRDVSPGVIGAITLVRCSGNPDIGFMELGILSQVADLTGAARAACAGISLAGAAACSQVSAG